MKVAVPSWRPDVHGRADIVEEIVRIVGVDSVPPTPFPRGENARKPVLTPIQLRTRKAKRALAARGMVEAVTWSFVSKREAELFGGGKPELALANPIAADLSDMRPSLVPGPDHGGADAMPIAASPTSRCSRSGRFSKATGRKINSPRRPASAARWRSPTAPAGIGRARRSRSTCSTPRRTHSPCSPPPGAPMQALQIVPGGPAWLHPGRSGTIQMGPQNVLGHFGELHPRTLAALKAEGPLVGFEVILETIPEPKAKADARQAGAGTVAVPAGRARFRLRRRPQRESRRHRARGAERRPQADHRASACSTSTKARASIPDKKSIAIAVTIQPREKTMTDEEIEALAQQDRRRSAQAHRRSVARVEHSVVLITEMLIACRRSSAPLRSYCTMPAANPHRQILRARPSRRRARDAARQHRPGRQRRCEIRRSRRTDRHPAAVAQQVAIEAAAGEIRRQLLQIDGRQDTPRRRRRSSRAPARPSAGSQSGNTGVMPVPASFASR